jgi:conjugative relaxase-like TrwC/TraI family protein
VLRVRTIFASSAESAAAYYTRYLTEAPGEVPGLWTGDQAAALGLAGEVSGDDLLAVLEGRDPVSGTRLGRPLLDRHLTNGGVVRAVAGFDATFSAPKSLSVLWALTQDERLLAAHDVAVAATLAHLERFGSTTRVRSRSGRLYPDSQGLTMAAFRQTTSRSDDPQIHTHVVVSGKVQTLDGRWMALDARYLKKHQRMLGGLYQSVLRNQLAHELGIVWRPITTGQAEIDGVPDELLAVFAKRADQIEHAVADQLAVFRGREGRDPNQWELAAIKRQAAVDTRTSKSGQGVDELVTRWQHEAASIGWDAPGVLDTVGAAAREAGPESDRISVDEIVAALSTSGSTWNRAQIVSAVCDTARPQTAVDSERWAQVIEGLADSIIERCVELDPGESVGPRRRSDGRSMWLEPISTHLTSEAILREEELVLSWAIDAQTDPPHSSPSVVTSGLDVLQAGAAAAVAGADRLVLVVGPAGAGKTTMLRAAVNDLADNGRGVFGVAPTAKAARVLERETGVGSDTLAKLLHEWHRHDRPLDPRYQLPAGTTVLVDEAGMLSTPALARLVGLAQQHHWRLALMGDPHQLQAVGRGGLFHELCATGDVHELVRIHRFREQWEAAASLQLRHGDPHALDSYLAHDRIQAGSLEQHLATITDTWLTATARDDTVAVVCSTNDHVDTVNTAIQTARIDHGDLDPTTSAQIAGRERAGVGDLVVTRRNQRDLNTSAGEPVRNRELWHVTHIGADGSLTVSATPGHGAVTLPAEYVREHVRLGYAATEHGYQGDTVTVGIELASNATTRRGLYTGATRGTDHNQILVVTDSTDLNEARDTLERILASDRADSPAVTTRRQLAQLDHRPTARRPQPRCEIPDWFHDLRDTVQRDLVAAQHNHTQAEADRSARSNQLAEAKQQLAIAEHGLYSYRPALAAADADVDAARQQLWTANREARNANRWHRRSTQHASDTAEHELASAVERRAAVRSDAGPALNAVNTAHTRIRTLDDAIHSYDILDRWTDHTARVEDLRALAAALDDWGSWADGRHLPTDHLTPLIDTLSSHAATHPDSLTLARTIQHWANNHGIELHTPHPSPTPTIEIDL